jgi:hypothetical protein
LTEEERTVGEVPGAARDHDAKIEGLAQRMIDAINSAEPEQRQILREYAVDMLKAGTEIVEPAARKPGGGAESSGNPLGIALLLGMASLPMMLLFLPVGLTLLALALVLGLWGVVSMAVRR